MFTVQIVNAGSMNVRIVVIVTVAAAVSAHASVAVKSSYYI